jgi:hypothetical protein
MDGDIEALHQLLSIAQSDFESDSILTILNQTAFSNHPHSGVISSELHDFYQKNPKILDKFIEDHHVPLGKKYGVRKIGHRNLRNATQVKQEELEFIKYSFLSELLVKASE